MTTSMAGRDPPRNAIGDRPLIRETEAARADVDIADLNLPTWRKIVDRGYHAWDRAYLVLDTSVTSVQDCVATIRRIAGL